MLRQTLESSNEGCADVVLHDYFWRSIGTVIELLQQPGDRVGVYPRPQISQITILRADIKSAPASNLNPCREVLRSYAEEAAWAHQVLEEFLKPLGMSQSAFAVRLGVSFPRLHEIVRGKRGVTPDTALRLARVTGMSADFWLGLQQDWDLWHALHSRSAAVIDRLEPLTRAGWRLPQ